MSGVGGEIPSARFRGRCLHLARVVLAIWHTSQLGHFGKRVLLKEDAVPTESWTFS